MMDPHFQMTAPPKQRTRYVIWRRQHSGGDWLKTAHVVSAVSDADAQARMRRLFAGAGLHSMSLIAMLEGVTPNAQAQPRPAEGGASAGAPGWAATNGR